MEKICEFCEKPCEGHEVAYDDSFYYEYGPEARTHVAKGVDILSECCDAEMRDPVGAECWEPETLKSETFKFLNELRESGKTNMFGAVPYIVREMEISEADAKALLVDWMKNFDPEKREAKNEN